MKKLRWALLGSLVATLSFGAVACGDDDDTSSDDDTEDDDSEDDDSEDDDSEDDDSEDDDSEDDDSEDDDSEDDDTDDDSADDDDTDDDSDDDSDDADAGTEEESDCPDMDAIADHENVDCDDDFVCVISGEVTDDLTVCHYDGDVTWVLDEDDNYVFIGDDEEETVLTIEAGTTVYALGSTALVVQRYSKLMAEGTADAPIYLTSNAAGDRAAGDWGGLVINGNGVTNVGADVGGEANTGTYGGDDNDDSSGVLNYVSVSFAGNLVDTENELNGIAFQGVGGGTEVDYIQVHHNKDDGVEFFGGAVWAKHVVLTNVEDDSIDWTDGWVGGMQFAVVDQQESESDNGIEGDNNGDDTVAEPISSPVLANITLIASTESSGEGVQLRAGTSAELHNIVVTGFADGCFTVEEVDEISIANSVLACGDPETDLVFGHLDDDGMATDVEASETAWGDNDTIAADSAMLDGWVPEEGSPLLDAESPEGDDLDEAAFIGGIGEDDWTDGWIITEDE